MSSSLVLLCTAQAVAQISPAGAALDLPQPVVQANHAGTITALRVAPMGDWVASGARDGTVKVWSRRSGLLLNTIGISSSWVRSLAFSADGRQIAVGAGDHIVYLYEALSGTLLKRFGGANSAVTAVAFSPDNTLLAAGTARDSAVHLWRIDDAAVAGSAPSRKAPIRALAFRPETGSLLVADASSVSEWKVGASGAAHELPQNGNLPADSGAIGASLRATDKVPVAVDAANKVIATADGTAIVWSEKVRSEPSRYAPISAASLRALRFARDDRTLITSSNTGDVAIWDLETGALASYLPDAAGTTAAFASAIALSADGTTLSAVRGDSRSHWSWQLSSLTPLALPRRTDSNNGFTADYFPEQGADIGGPAPLMPPQLGIADNPEEFVTTRAVLTNSGAVALYGGFTTPTFFPYVTAQNLRTGAQMWTYRGPQRGNVNALAADPDGKIVTVALADKTLVWLDGSSGTVRHTTSTPTETSINVMEYSPDGSLVAGASFAGQLMMWRADGSVLAAPFSHGETVLSLAFSKDQRFLASGGTDDSIRVWNIPSGTLARTLNGHTAAVTALRFAHGSDILASGSEDSSLRVWNVRTGEFLAAAFAMPGGDWMAISSEGFFDGTRRGWNAVPFRFKSAPTVLYRPEQFFAEFYQPGLLGDVVARQQPMLSVLRERKDRRAALNVAALKDSKPPKVRLQVRNPIAPGAATVHVDVAVSDAGSGMRDLRIFRNQSLVRVVHDDLTGGGKVSRFNAPVEIELTAGANEISAYAFNRDDIKSEDAIANVSGSEALRRPGKAYIVAVGVNHYANADFDLNYAAPDAGLVAEGLRASFEAMRAQGGIEPVVLTNQEATKDNILFALKRLAGQQSVALPTTPAKLLRLQRAEPKDAVVFYFAGHGEAADGEYYLLPHDLGYSGPRANLKPTDWPAIYASSLSDLQLNESLEQIDAGRMLVAIDACYSGQVLESAESRRGPLNTRGMAQLAYEKGAYVLAASQSDTAARELQRLEHGVLTYVLIEKGLRNFLADTNDDGAITVREWFRYAGAEVPRELASLNEEHPSSGDRLIAVGGRALTPQRPQSYFRRDLPDDWLIAKRAR